jgi:hypothetical protein
MPTLFILNGWKIVMYRSETEEPHFHVYKAGLEYRYRLRDLEQMPTDKYPAPDGLSRLVRDWGQRNREALDAAWRALQADSQPDKSRFRD